MTDAFDLRSTRLHKGTTLLEASAGTGKTYTITGIVLRLLLEEVVPDIGQILVVTFTVAATEELKTRLRNALTLGLRACTGDRTGDPFLDELGSKYGAQGAAILRRALAMADEMSVATIHGFCRRVLEEAAFESAEPFGAEFVDDELPLVAEAARDAVRLEIQARDLMAAAVAVYCKLLPERLADLYREFARHRGTVVRPAGGDPDAALARARTVRSELGAMAAAGRLPVAALARLRWNPSSKCPLRDVDALADRLTARLCDDGDACLDWLLELRPERLRETLPRHKKYTPPPLDDPFFDACTELAAAVALAGHALLERMLATVGARLLREKQRLHALSFQDLLERVAFALRDPRLGKTLCAAIQARWRVALIDEFQDTDPLQYEVFARCFGDRRLLLVGDPKQSIYGFRGADVRAYLQASRDAAARHTLGDNWRSHPDLLTAVERVFAGRDPFAVAGIELQPARAALPAADCALLGDDGPALQIRCLGPGTNQKGAPSEHNREFAEERIVRDVADECVRLLRDDVRLGARGGSTRRLGGRDLAVLTRTNAQAVAVQDALRARGVHSAIGKAGDVFRCPEMDDMQRLLLALSTPGYLPWLRAAWTTPLFGLDRQQILALDQDQDALGLAIERGEELRRTWVRHGFVVMFEQLLALHDARRRLLRRPDGERKLTNYLQIAELLHHAEMARQLAPESLVQWLEHERRHAQEIDYELRELRLESDEDAVQILTVHGSKGLQYEVVFVPFAWGWRDPQGNRTHLLGRDGDAHVLAVDADAIGQIEPQAAQDQLAEDLRLLYVALTRTRRRCYLHWAAVRRANLSALGRRLLSTPAGDDGSGAVRWLTGPQELAARSNGTIGCVEIPVDPPPGEPARLPAGAGPRLAKPRQLPPPARPGFRIGSFTAMLARDAGHEPLREADEADADPLAPPPAPPAGMFAFARGSKAGVCLHEILEHVDFAAIDDDRTAATVRDTLWRHGMHEARTHLLPIDAPAVVHGMVRALAQAALAPLPFRLCDVGARARSAEWQFVVAAGRAAPRDLAALFREFATPELRPYADRLATLPALPLHGFLRGFVDLVVEHDGRYHVFDWKSNWLGAAGADYARPHLLLDVQRNHYVLQYHLYQLALHRHLRSRLRDYDYDRHLGHACYVYLRGIGHGDAGVFCDRPPRALIEALDRWLLAEARR